MRVLMTVLVLLVPFTALMVGQSETDDPYSLSLVSYELKANSGGRRVVHSWSQKSLVQLGDGVSIAILKLLSPEELKDPEKIKDYLPIVKSAFTQPQLISLETNKDPKVTLFLLDYVRQNVSDPQTRDTVQQTREFILAMLKRKQID